MVIVVLADVAGFGVGACGVSPLTEVGALAGVGVLGQPLGIITQFVSGGLDWQL